MKTQLKLLLIFLIFMLLINPLLVGNENNESSLGEDEKIVWTIDLINRYCYEAIILTRMENDTLYFLIDSTATQIRVSEIQNEIEISHETLSSKEELEEEAIRTENEGLEELFKEYLNGAIVLKMQIDRSDVGMLPLIVRINYNGVPESSDEPSGFIDIYKNKININFEDPKERINRSYLILPEDFDIWYRDIEEDTMEWENERIKLMWKNSERGIKHIRIHAGTPWERMHWENREIAAWHFILTLIGLFLAITIPIRFVPIKKFLDYKEKKETILSGSLIIFFILIIVYLGFYIKLFDFPIETHLHYWTIGVLLILTAIHFGLERFYEKYIS